MENLRIVGSHPGKRLATAGDILVEASSRLQLDIVCNKIVVQGRVKGSVLAGEYVEIGKTGQVIGDISAPKLVVRDGGLMQGRFVRTASEESAAIEANEKTETPGIKEPMQATSPEAPPQRDNTRPQPRPLKPMGF